MKRFVPLSVLLAILPAMFRAEPYGTQSPESDFASRGN